ncbi:MAG TPA: zf-HC2 domain-containing protein, partial [Thermomicrobiales bacterium]|nr:zf-HC2 domain-containing protein [Thermomicrobiales bacterium]
MTTHRHHKLNSDWGCAQIQDEIEAWSIGALDPAEAAAVERHLAMCRDSRHEATRWREVAGMLPFTLEPMNPSGSTKRVLMARIAEDQMKAHQPDLVPRLSAPSQPNGSATPAMQRRFHWSQVLITPLAIALVVMTLWSFELRGQLDSVEAGGAEGTSASVPDSLQSFQMQS